MTVERDVYLFPVDPSLLGRSPDCCAYIGQPPVDLGQFAYLDRGDVKDGRKSFSTGPNLGPSRPLLGRIGSLIKWSCDQMAPWIGNPYSVQTEDLGKLPNPF